MIYHKLDNHFIIVLDWESHSNIDLLKNNRWGFGVLVKNLFVQMVFNANAKEMSNLPKIKVSSEANQIDVFEQ